jgi:dethiobiotin synthetase
VTGLRGPVVVTGTDTGVGKTIVTAAIAAAAAARGLSVAVLKPAQTGVGPGDESDVDTIVRLAAPAAAETAASYPDPLAPATAARVAGRPAIELDDVVATARARAAAHDVVLVEGAGGLLVPMGLLGPTRPEGASWTVADLAVRLDAPTVVVVRAGLGTLNHTALTLEALQRRGVPALVVIGAWPTPAELVHRTNLTDLVASAGRLAGAVPDGAGALSRAAFTERAASWLGPELHGTFDPAWLTEPAMREG